MKDFGFIRADKAGRTVWPFRLMSNGDFFRVEPWERDFASVRALAYNRAAQIGRPREYTTRRDEHGNAVVTRNANGVDLPRRPKVLGYGAARDALKVYGVNLDSLPVHTIERGQSYRHNAPRNEPVGHAPFFVMEALAGRLGVVQDDKGFTVERVADDETFQTFAPRKMLLS